MSITNEKTILVSNDNSITLTSHRVIQREKNLHIEINLIDFLSHSIVKKRYNYYKILSLIFGVITLILAILMKNSYDPSQYDNTERNQAFTIIILISAFLTLISFIMIFTTSTKYLRISGKFNSIDFSIEKLSESGLAEFLNKMSIESENRKRAD